MGDKTFNLTWNNHLANLSGLFEGLYKSGSLTDTTLACQGGMLRAHRLVLAACSPYFERVFKEHYGEQPILILKGVPVEEMECLLDFMYRGSINVAEEHLPSLIKTATDLEIRGLSGDHRTESNNIYPRIETRGQACQVETRLHPMGYRKSQQVSFLSKPACGSSMADVKLEEIEVEDDPMIMEGHEDSFEESLPQVRDQIRHIPPPMFKRNTRFDSHQRAARNQAKEQGRRGLLDDESNNDESYDNEGVKSEPIFNSNSDPTVPAIQMNEDSMDHGRSNMNSPNAEGLDGTKFKIIKTDNSEETGTAADPAKERKKNMSKSKAQFKPFPCDLCTLAFTRASHLARHRRVHTGERPFACTLCPRMFARQDKLKQHLDSHHQWPKQKALSGYGGSSQHGTSTNLIAKGKRGRPRKVSIEQSAMDEIMKFGEFSSMLNKSQPLSTRMSGRRLQEDPDSMRKMHDDNEDEIEDLRCKKTDNYGCNGRSIE